MENMSTKKAAEFLTESGRPVRDTTMTWWRARGVGPVYYRVMGRISYARADLEAFLQSGRRDPAMKA